MGFLGTGHLLDAPAWLLLLAVVPLAWWMGRRRGRAAVRFGAFPLLESSGTVGSWRGRMAFVPRLLEALALALWIVALARPVERIELERQTEGLDVLLCLDVSSSMTATELSPTSAKPPVPDAGSPGELSRSRRKTVTERNMNTPKMNTSEGTMRISKMERLLLMTSNSVP